MAAHMLALGDYRFSIATAAYGELRRRASWRWRSQERIGRRPALQYLGPGEESIEVGGVVYPTYKGGVGQVAAMRTEAGRGRPLLLVSGTGEVLGKWVISGVEETLSLFFADGTPRRSEFRLRLTAYGDEEGSNA